MPDPFADHRQPNGTPHERRALLKAAPCLFVGLYAALAFAAFRHGAPTPVLIGSLVLAAALIALSVIDLQTQRLPDALTVPLMIVGPTLAFFFSWASPLWLAGSGLAAFIFLYAVAYGYRALRGRDGLGLGDAKLLAAAGAWLGLEAVPSVLLWSCASALITVIGATLLGQALTPSSRIPFGPFLSFGFWLVWLYGPAALN